MSAVFRVIPLMLSLAAPPAPPPEPPAHRYEGIALIGTGWVMAAGWLATKLAVTASDPAEARRGPRDCEGRCYKGPLLHAVGAPLLVGSMALLGVGLRRYSRHLVAHDYPLY